MNIIKTLIIASAFLTSAAWADATLDNAGVNYIYNTEGKLIVLKTKRTATAVEADSFGLFEPWRN